MRKIRTLVVSGFSAFFKQGGGEAEAASLQKNLVSQGFDADLYGPFVSELETYDLVIFFSCHPSGMELLEACVNFGVKFLFWPNFWVEHGREPAAHEIELINKYCQLSDRIVFKSETETALFHKYFIFNNDNVLRVNWFVDSELFYSANPGRFRELYSIDNYILSVGLIEPVKNQLTLINAARLAGKQLVLIGGFRKKDYFEECVRASNGSVVFIPHQPGNSPILKAAYAGCESYVEVSFDPPGRSSLEAAYFGRPMVLSSSDWAKEIFNDTAMLVDPTSAEKIQHALNVVGNSTHQNFACKRQLSNHHLPDFALAELYSYVNTMKAYW